MCMHATICSVVFITYNEWNVGVVLAHEHMCCVCIFVVLLFRIKSSSPPWKRSLTHRYTVPLKAFVYNISLIYNHFKKSQFLSEKISK